ncbi:hypothetical protein TSAR_001494 [Trichomalopsis sarcophagae]|uniref:UPAR/Ly6 domain-containing protein n=1 Tax=Trichomalopsis sarcophagae TaxID=543379 RepID=A0A232FBY2_9HYME|nr:hypothetical protein TSAR_001494 [Trichomalopsis sarcophagae]
MQIDKNLDGTIVKKSVASVRYGYLDSPKEITNANNNTEIKAENDSNKTSISNLNTVCLNNLISEKVQTQSSTEIPNRSPTKPVKNYYFNDNCMKDHHLQTIADKLETKTDEIYAQPSVKDPEENVHKILQAIRTLMTKLELQYDSRSVEKIKDTQEEATSNDRSSESRNFHETKMQNTLAIKPVQKKDEVLSITKEKLNNKNDEADTQSSIKESEENIHKTLQESQTLEEKLILDSKDDPRNIEEIEDTQEKSRSDSSSESHIFHEIMKAQSSVNELSKQHILSLFIPQNLFCSGILFPDKEKKMQIWTVVLVGALCLGASNALECYVCKNQEGNIEKCLNTIKTCEQGEDTCLSEIKWGSTPYWNQGAKKQFYISKRCSTKRECERIRRANMPDCSHIWYQDWKCSDCCQGDRCNYYIVSGTDKVGTTVMMFLFPLFAIWILQ